MNKKLAWGGAVIFFCLLWGAPSQAKIVGLFDFDGTLVEDRGPTSAWITPWILKRVEQLHTTFQQLPNRPVEVTLREPEQILYYNQKYGTDHPLGQDIRVMLTLPDQITVSYDEFQRIEAFLAKGEAILGGLKPMMLTFDPMHPERQLLILPGYYRTFDLTFKYYRESTNLRAKNYIRSDFVEARERVRSYGDDHTWQGFSFPLFQAFMASESTVSNVQLFTSRGHKQTDYNALWDEMARGGDIRNSRTAKGLRPMVHSLSRPEARIYGRNLVEKKMAVVRSAVESLYHSAGQKHWVLNRNGGAYRHTLIVAEDEPSYVEAIASFMLNASGTYYADRLELVLVNTGSDLEVANSRFPQRWTRFEAGRRARPATPEEIANWQNPEFHQDSMKVTDVDCNDALKGVKP